MRVLLLYPPTDGHARRLRAAAPEAEIRVAGSLEDAAQQIADADVVLGNRWFLQSLPRARRLAWMQSNSVGMDLLLASDRVRQGTFTLTCARGVYDDELADHAVALTLSLARGLHRARDAQARREWVREPLRPLRGRRALVLGAGAVGSAVAVRLAAMGVVCEGACRHPRRDPAPFSTLTTEWRDRLPAADLLILALPLTPRTRNALGAGELARLPGGALVVNVARGELLDEEALRAELPRLGGAALDVFRTEPLPPDHWMWAEPQVLVSPHLGRSPEAGPPRFEALFEENLRRFARREPLLNVVDVEEGY